MVTKTEIDLMKTSIIGKKDKVLIIDGLSEMDLHLGMKIDWPSNREQVKALVKKLNPEAELTPVFIRPNNNLDLSFSCPQFFSSDPV